MVRGTPQQVANSDQIRFLKCLAVPMVLRINTMTIELTDTHIRAINQRPKLGVACMQRPDPGTVPVRHQIERVGIGEFELHGLPRQYFSRKQYPLRLGFG